MSNYIEYNDTIAFHPGYYIKEIVEESGLTQEDFAKRLDTTPKNLSLLIRGEQSLSIDIAMKLSRMLGTSVNYWLNLQNSYDALIAEFKSQEELLEERKVFELYDYKYFRENYGLPDLPRKKDEQIKAVREFLKVATLTVREVPCILLSVDEAQSGMVALVENLQRRDLDYIEDSSYNVSIFPSIFASFIEFSHALHISTTSSLSSPANFAPVIIFINSTASFST